MSALCPRHKQRLLNARLLTERGLAKKLKLQHERASQGRTGDVPEQTLCSQQMLGMVSHDLRTPLQGISLATQLLQGRAQQAETLQLLERISLCVARAQRLVAELLDFTLAQAGQGISIHPRHTNLQQAVAGCVQELRCIYPGQRLIHQHRGEPNALFDPDRLYQVIGNLVANAVAYGDPQLPVRVLSSTLGSTVTVSVHNWGTPIACETLGCLFEPLMRGCQQPVKASNVGLGLFIVKEIAKAHGGDVSVVSTPQEGTRFSVRFALPATGGGDASTERPAQLA